MPLLRVEHLRTYFYLEHHVIHAVDDISFTLDAGETLALIGESGAGKTVTALSLLRLIRPPGRIVNGEVWLNGQNLLPLADDAIRHHRGRVLSLMVQEPGSALNPMYTVAAQLIDAQQAHHSVDLPTARAHALRTLQHVGLADPELRLDQYPHQLSRGMKQRVLLAMALINEPQLLIADEPTTGWDPVTQAQMVRLLQDLTRRRIALLLITHDLALVAHLADRVAVMYAGQIVETAPVDTFFREPKHPYTQGLFHTLLDLRHDEPQLQPIPGLPPDPAHYPPACRYHPRCPYVMPVCRQHDPIDIHLPGPRAIRCFLYGGS